MMMARNLYAEVLQALQREQFIDLRGRLKNLIVHGYCHEFLPAWVVRVAFSIFRLHNA